MNGYMDVKQAAKLWDISTRQVQKLCNEGRVEGAIQFVNVWAIPEDAPKPTRTAKSKPGPRPKTRNEQTDEAIASANVTNANQPLPAPHNMKS